MNLLTQIDNLFNRYIEYKPDAQLKSQDILQFKLDIIAIINKQKNSISICSCCDGDCEIELNTGKLCRSYNRICIGG
jgi:hypothetical protein